MEAQASNPIRWRDAFRALYDLYLDNDDTTHVFRIIEALKGDTNALNVARMKESAMGRQILDERRSLLPILSDRERLRALPEGTLGRVYLDFMEREGLSADGLAQASIDGGDGAPIDPELTTFGNWARDSHDLWHVLTGYGRDPLGELCLLGVLYSQIKSRGTAFIALLGMSQATYEYPGAPVFRAVAEGFRIGRQAEWMIAQDWEALVAEPFEEVRSKLGLERPVLYERSLPLHDVSRSNSQVAQAAAA